MCVQLTLGSMSLIYKINIQTDYCQTSGFVMDSILTNRHSFLKMIGPSHDVSSGDPGPKFIRLEAAHVRYMRYMHIPEGSDTVLNPAGLAFEREPLKLQEIPSGSAASRSLISEYHLDHHGSLV